MDPSEGSASYLHFKYYVTKFDGGVENLGKSADVIFERSPVCVGLSVLQRLVDKLA